MLNPAYIVDVKLSIELLMRLIEQADEATWLTLEGDLCQFDERGLTGVMREVVSPASESPEECLYCNRVAIPLNQENVSRIKRDVLPRVGIRSLICHVFLDRGNTRLFAGYDRFSQGACLSDWVSIEFLRQLEELGIIRPREHANDEKQFSNSAVQQFTGQQFSSSAVSLSASG